MDGARLAAAGAWSFAAVLGADGSGDGAEGSLALATTEDGGGKGGDGLDEADTLGRTTTAEALASRMREEVFWVLDSWPSDEALRPRRHDGSSAELHGGSGAAVLGGEGAASAEGAGWAASASSASTPLPPADPWCCRPAAWGFLPFNLSSGEGPAKYGNYAKLGKESFPISLAYLFSSFFFSSSFAAAAVRSSSARRSFKTLADCSSRAWRGMIEHQSAQTRRLEGLRLIDRLSESTNIYGIQKPGRSYLCERIGELLLHEPRHGGLVHSRD